MSLGAAFAFAEGPLRRARALALVVATGAALALVGAVASPGLAHAKPPAPQDAKDAKAGKAAKAGEPASADLARAHKLHDEAKALYGSGHYRAAIEKLEAARTLDPEGKELVYNLALIREKLGEPDRAAADYRAYLALETDPKLRASAEAALKRAEGATRERAVARPGDAAGAPGQAVDAPGEAASGTPSASGAPSARGRGLSPVTIAASIGAGAALATAGAFAIAALATSPGADPRTGPGTSIDDLQARASRAHGFAVVTDVALGVAIAGAATAVIAELLRPAAPRAPASARR